jgi:hypothetical protein
MLVLRMFWSTACSDSKQPFGLVAVSLDVTAASPLRRGRSLSVALRTKLDAITTKVSAGDSHLSAKKHEPSAAHDKPDGGACHDGT